MEVTSSTVVGWDFFLRAFGGASEYVEEENALGDYSSL
jgi:hypothetical protein